jgi:hypothetical protein
MRLSQIRHAVLASAVLAGLLCAGPATAVVPNDTFEGTAVDASRWHVSATPDASATVADGRLVLTAGATGAEAEASVSLLSTWRLRGVFDVQVDFTLLTWPDDLPASVGLLAIPPGGDYAVERSCGDPAGTGSLNQLYVCTLRPYGTGTLATAAASGLSGALRLARDASGRITGYYWDESASEWVEINSFADAPGEVGIRLSCRSEAGTEVQVAFDNFTVNQGEVVEPIINDFSLVRRTEADEQGRVHHSLSVGAEISDPEGLSDIASLTVEGLDGTTWAALPGARPYPVQWLREDDNTAQVYWGIPLDQAPTGGGYTVTLTDAAANTDAMDTPGNPDMPAPFSLTHPAPAFRPAPRVHRVLRTAVRRPVRPSPSTRPARPPCARGSLPQSPARPSGRHGPPALGALRGAGREGLAAPLALGLRLAARAGGSVGADLASKVGIQCVPQLVVPGPPGLDTKGGTAIRDDYNEASVTVLSSSEAREGGLPYPDDLLPPDERLLPEEPGDL